MVLAGRAGVLGADESYRVADVLGESGRPRPLHDPPSDETSRPVRRYPISDGDLALYRLAVREAERESVASGVVLGRHPDELATPESIHEPSVVPDEVEAAVRGDAALLEDYLAGVEETKALDGRDRKPRNGGHGEMVRDGNGPESATTRDAPV